MKATSKTHNNYAKHIKDFKFLGTFSSKDKQSELTLVPFIEQHSLHEYKDISGVYLICIHGANLFDDPIVFYVGQTIISIVGRICQHLRSFDDPTWGNECSGKSFIRMCVDTRQLFDIHYIESNILGIEDDIDSIIAEKSYQKIFNPIVKDMKHSNLKYD